MTFDPGGLMTRGMLVTVLWRLASSPEAADGGFSDVPEGAWYSKAVNWAATNNIAGGYGGRLFGPEDTVTREQMALILYQYAVYAGINVSVEGNLDGFSDGGQTSEWARRAMIWATGAGLINGKDGGLLDPQGAATRAEVAAILHRFIEGN
jgi:hypothetical protein